MLEDWRLERWQGFDRCQWVAYLNVWQQPVIPDGRKEFMLIAARMALEEGFAVISITDGKTRVLVSMTLSMPWQWATC